MTARDFLIKLLEINGILDKYVVLKEDGNGRYIEYAFKEMNVNNLFAGHNPKNISSKKMLEKVGLE